jgi:hypothetical protein
MPIVFAFCRTAPSVRFIAFATAGTGVLAFECALSSRTSSLVHGLRTKVFIFGIALLPLVGSAINIVASDGRFKCSERPRSLAALSMSSKLLVESTPTSPGLRLLAKVFTDFGVESLVELIKIQRESTSSERALKSKTSDAPLRPTPDAYFRIWMKFVNKP